MPDSPTPVDLAVAELIRRLRSNLRSDDIRSEAARGTIALQAAGVGTWDWIDGGIHWDQQTLILFDRTRPPEDIDDMLTSVHPDDRDMVRHRLSEIARMGGDIELEHRVIRRDGTVHWITSRGIAIVDETGSVTGIIGVSIDVTRFKRVQEALAAEKAKVERLARRLEHLSNTDGLTGLPNRRALENRLDAEWRRSLRSGESLAVIIFDIDEFKQYNDRFGHLAGDGCLQRIGATLRAGCRRAGDTLGRLGGEEFLAVLPGSTLEEAAELAEVLRTSVEELGVGSGKPGRVVTVSAGVSAAVPSRDESVEDLMAAADLALYDAKASGRNRVSTSSYPLAAGA